MERATKQNGRELKMKSRIDLNGRRAALFCAAVEFRDSERFIGEKLVKLSGLELKSSCGIALGILISLGPTNSIVSLTPRIEIPNIS